MTSKSTKFCALLVCILCLAVSVAAQNLAKRQLDFDWVLKPEVDEQLNVEEKPAIKSTAKGRGKGNGKKRKKVD